MEIKPFMHRYGVDENTIATILGMRVNEARRLIDNPEDLEQIHKDMLTNLDRIMIQFIPHTDQMKANAPFVIAAQEAASKASEAYALLYEEHERAKVALASLQQQWEKLKASIESTQQLDTRHIRAAVNCTVAAISDTGVSRERWLAEQRRLRSHSLDQLSELTEALRIDIYGKA